MDLNFLLEEPGPPKYEALRGQCVINAWKGCIRYRLGSWTYLPCSRTMTMKVYGGTFDIEMDWGAWSVDEQCERDTGL